MRRKLQLLKPRLEAAQKRETDEMLGKLKGLGNSLLGKSILTYLTYLPSRIFCPPFPLYLPEH